jgi:two-component system, NtrC family, nitrogen regulation sensor histidine kinase NtrY
VKPLNKNIFLNRYGLLVLSLLLFALSLIFNRLYTNRTSVIQEVKAAEAYLKKQNDDFSSLLKDSLLIGKLVSQNETLKGFSAVTEKNYGLFFYSVPEFGAPVMKFWNKQLITPADELIGAADGEYFRKLSNGYYVTIKKTIVLQGNTVYAFAMVPVRQQFFITSDYLPEKFFFGRNADKRVKISNRVTEFAVKGETGTPLFYLDRRVSVSIPYNDSLTVILRISALLVFLFFIYHIAAHIAVTKGVWAGIGLFSSLLLLMRLSSYVFPSLLNLRQFDFFDPAVYGSNIVQRSLGDLLINAILFSCIVLFAWAKLKDNTNPAAGLSKKGKWVSGTIALLLLILSTFAVAGIIRSLVADSKISFDVTNFYSINNKYTVAGFIALACLSLAYYYFFQLLFRFIFPLFKGKSWLIYFIIALIGLIYLSLRPGKIDVLFYLPVLVWLIGYTWLSNSQHILFSKININIAGILSWIFIFSVSISAIMLSENKKVEMDKRKLIAEKLAIQSDPSSERLMSIAIKYIDSGFLRENFYRFGNAVQSKTIRDSIITDSYSGYLNKYDTRLYVYDAANKPLFNEEGTTYDALNTIYQVESKPTETEGLSYYERSFDKFNYITRKEVTDTAGKKAGTFFIISNLRNYSRDALFPELFRQFKETDPENSPIYSNAVYIKGRLVSPPGNYPFPIFLDGNQVPRETFHSNQNDDYDELWYKSGKDKVVIIARKRETAIEAITLFSYIFCSLLFVVAIVQLAGFVIRTIGKKGALKRLLQLNIRSQVHSTIIFISVFSFLIIGAATITFFISRNKQGNNDKLSRTMKIMVKEMEKKLADHRLFDDEIKFYDSLSNLDLQKLVDEVSDIHGVDVNVYDLEGGLQVSSEANVYNKGVLSKKMDPLAFYHLSRLRQVQHVQDEKVGNFSYLSIYSPVRDEYGKANAFVNIPYFTSRPELRQEISNFLVTIINLNAFIFLIAGLIALFITNRITHSFSIISDKMKEVNLGKKNEPIVWNRNDEIGELVQEYNKMVTKLGDSATALAKNEREGAWREMARQVAHEIKNPLTPMKLSIQYLQKAIANNQPNVQELSGSVANTLVEQIDHLSKIAADFSQFANIGNTQVELFDLHEVLASLKDLFATNSHVQFVWWPVLNPIMVEADKTQMNRLFTNLLTNAMQACGEQENCRIEINERREGDEIRISIKDNGEGIPEDMQDKIFVPNFTTKSSGTGLGLAMCKGIVEQAKGKIWFDTKHDAGTTFYVELPLHTG